MERKKINEAIKYYKLPFKNSFELLSYVKLSIQSKNAKFNFTRIIDLIFKKVKEISRNNLFRINDLSYLSIQDIILIEKKNSRKLKKQILNKINKNKQKHKIFSCIRLPQLIMDPNHSAVIPFQKIIFAQLYYK